MRTNLHTSKKKKNGRVYWEVGEPLYPNALFTPAEKAKIYPNVKDVAFEIVDIPKNKVYFFFGLRFWDANGDSNKRSSKK